MVYLGVRGHEPSHFDTQAISIATASGAQVGDQSRSLAKKEARTSAAGASDAGARRRPPAGCRGKGRQRAGLSLTRQARLRKTLAHHGAGAVDRGVVDDNDLIGFAERIS